MVELDGFDVRCDNLPRASEQGANPTVQHFLALHKHYYPIKSHRIIEPEQLDWLAVVDAQRKDRFGRCAAVRSHP